MASAKPQSKSGEFKLIEELLGVSAMEAEQFMAEVMDKLENKKKNRRQQPRSDVTNNSTTTSTTMSRHSSASTEGHSSRLESKLDEPNMVLTMTMATTRATTRALSSSSEFGNPFERTADFSQTGREIGGRLLGVRQPAPSSARDRAVVASLRSAQKNALCAADDVAARHRVEVERVPRRASRRARGFPARQSGSQRKWRRG